ncbi:hypothetical protein [Streptomyces iconiensis]|uniref:hypothetical protein n=1 Tax=Streptomyces iconiensis TaxID=1384038 RepID=UPI0024BCBAF3|nr:hypothetical protein [Streptomyces iconiensis]
MRPRLSSIHVDQLSGAAFSGFAGFAGFAAFVDGLLNGDRDPERVSRRGTLSAWAVAREST